MYSKFIRMIILAAICIVIPHISGCTSSICIDLYEHQPYCGYSEKVQAYYIRKGEIETYHDWVEWRTQDGRIFNSNDILDKCDNFLRAKNLWNKPIPIELSENFRYPWGLHEVGLATSIVYEQSKPPRYETSRQSDVGYNTIRTIVCFNPIVVVCVSGGIYYYDFIHDFSPKGKNLSCGYKEVNEVYVVLDRGYAYGTRMPYDPNPEWFSPDMNVTPQPVEMLSKDNGRIPVPWGWLILTRENDEWVVTTKAK